MTGIAPADAGLADRCSMAANASSVTRLSLSGAKRVAEGAGRPGMGHLGRAGNSEEAEEAVDQARERDVFVSRQ